MKKKKDRVILFQGTFDLINMGHIKAFALCKEKGGKLIVALNTDKLIRSYKHREPVLPYEHRKIILDAIKYIDKVVPASHFSPMDLLKKHNANVYAVGSEWVEAHQSEIQFIKENGGEIIITPDFKGVIHSSEMRKRIIAIGK